MSGTPGDINRVVGLEKMGGAREYAPCDRPRFDNIPSQGERQMPSSSEIPSPSRTVPLARSVPRRSSPWTALSKLPATEAVGASSGLSVCPPDVPSPLEHIPPSPCSSRSSTEGALPLPEHRVRKGQAAYQNALHSECRVRGGQFLRCTSSGLSCGSAGTDNLLSSTLHEAASCPSPWLLARSSPESLDATSSLGLPARAPGSDNGSYSFSLMHEPLSLLDYAEQMAMRNSDPSSGPAAAHSHACYSSSSASSLIKFAELSLQSRHVTMHGGLLEDDRRSC